MGYDFSFMRLSPHPTQFPFYAAPDFKGTVEPLREPEAMVKRMIESGRFRPNGGDYRWQTTPEGNLLDVSVGMKSVQVDTHSHWEHVLSLYELLLPLEDDLLIADNQTSTFYDAAAFRAFIEESYAQ
jgi:hypothetical protein